MVGVGGVALTTIPSASFSCVPRLCLLTWRRYSMICPSCVFPDFFLCVCLSSVVIIVCFSLLSSVLRRFFYPGVVTAVCLGWSSRQILLQHLFFRLNWGAVTGRLVTVISLETTVAVSKTKQPITLRPPPPAPAPRPPPALGVFSSNTQGVGARVRP